MNKINDWREEFHEVRVFVNVPVEFTVTVKAPNDYDAEQEVITISTSGTRTRTASNIWASSQVAGRQNCNLL